MNYHIIRLRILLVMLLISCGSTILQAGLFDWIRDAVSTVAEGINTAVTGVEDLGKKETWDKAGQDIASAAEKTKKGLESAGNAIKGAAEQAGSAMKSAGEAIGHEVVIAAEATGQGFKDLYDMTRQKASQAAAQVAADLKRPTAQVVLPKGFYREGGKDVHEVTAGSYKGIYEAYCLMDGSLYKLDLESSSSDPWIAVKAMSLKGDPIPLFKSVSVGCDGALYAIGAHDGKVYRYHRTEEEKTKVEHLKTAKLPSRKMVMAAHQTPRVRKGRPMHKPVGKLPKAKAPVKKQAHKGPMKKAQKVTPALHEKTAKPKHIEKTAVTKK